MSAVLFVWANAYYNEKRSTSQCMRKQKKYHNTNAIRHVARVSRVLYKGIGKRGAAEKANNARVRLKECK
jgi:hypothetical protein